MVQILVELTESERDRLAAVAKRSGKPESTVVREALRHHLDEEQEDEIGDEALRAAFGLWKDLGIDSIEYQRRIRSEWESNRDDK